MAKTQFAPARAELRPIEDFGISLHEDTTGYVHDSSALSKAFGGSGIKDIFGNSLLLGCVMTACCGGLLFGFDQGLMSIVLVMPKFLMSFPETDGTVTSSAAFQKGLLTGLLELGAFIGAILAGFTADKYSRKYAISFGLIWFIVGSTLQTSSFQFAQLIVGRTIGGVGIGILSSVAPMYISEVAPPNIRGALLVCEQFMIVAGIIIMFYITYATRHIDSEWSFRLPFLLQMVPALPLSVALWYLPYSPRWLAGKGRDQECLDTLVQLRRLPATDPRVQAEWITIRAEAVHNRESLLERHPKLQGTTFVDELKLEAASWLDMFSPAVIRRSMIGIMLMFFQQFVGINALIYYSPTLFETLGLDYEMRLTMSGVMNVLQIVGVTPAIFLMDRLGRKTMLYIGSFGMSVAHFTVAGLIAKYSYDWTVNGVQAWVGVAMIFMYMVSFGISWGPVPWSLPAEIHASSYRAKGVALSTCSNWLCNFIIGVATPPLVQKTGYGAFLFFGAFSVLSAVWTFFLCPETRGKTLEQMDAAFKTDQSFKDAEAKYQIAHIMCPQNRGASSPAEADLNNKGGSQDWVEKV